MPRRRVEPVWIAEPEILALHARLLARHGGAPGLRDRGLLLSALARPHNLFAYQRHPSLFVLAAAYTYGIVRTHPFIDGNKRVGFVAGILFLELNGELFAAPEPDAAQAVLDLAAGSLIEPAYAAFLRDHCH